MSKMVYLAATVVLLACTSSPAPGSSEDIAKDTVFSKDAVEIKFAIDTADGTAATEIMVEIIAPDQDIAKLDLTILECDPGEGCFMDKCDENGDCQSSSPLALGTVSKDQWNVRGLPLGS